MRNEQRQGSMGENALTAGDDTGGRESTDHVLPEHLQAMFAHSGRPARRVVAHVARLLRTFTDSPRVSSAARPDELAKWFASCEAPDRGWSLEQYLDFLGSVIVAHATRNSSPRALGHMASATPYFVRPISDLIVGLNQNMLTIDASKSLTLLERQALGMLHHLVFRREQDFYRRHAQDPESTLGIVVSGGTIANLTALWCARNRLLGPEDGERPESAEPQAALESRTRRRVVVVGSDSMHYSIDKAADLLGLGGRHVVRVPVDARERIDVGALKSALARCQAQGSRILAVVGVAGSTNCGTVDPLVEVGRLARRVGAHFHVDATWAGPLLFSDRHRHVLEGIDEADTVSLDGHKQMYLPIAVGTVLFKDPHAAKAVEKSAAYTIRAGSADLGRRAVEGSRPGSALLLHAALSLLGKEGFQLLIDANLRKARRFAELIDQDPAFQLLLTPTTNIVVYRYVPRLLRACDGARVVSASVERLTNELNTRLHEVQQAEGRSLVGRTLVCPVPGSGQPRVALRAVIANPLTTEEDLRCVLNEQREIAFHLDCEPKAAGPR